MWDRLDIGFTNVKMLVYVAHVHRAHYLVFFRREHGFLLTSIFGVFGGMCFLQYRSHGGEVDEILQKLRRN